MRARRAERCASLLCGSHFAHSPPTRTSAYRTSANHFYRSHRASHFALCIALRTLLRGPHFAALVLHADTRPTRQPPPPPAQVDRTCHRTSLWCMMTRPRHVSLPGATEVNWMLRPGAGSVWHCQPAARGLLSFLSLLRAFLLNAIKRNQADIGSVTTQHRTRGSIAGAWWVSSPHMAVARGRTPTPSGGI